MRRASALILGAGGSVVLIAVLLYLMLIDPAWTGIGRLERSLPQQRAQAAELERLLGEVKGLKSQPQVATVSSSEVKGAIETSLGAPGMKATRIVPLSDGDIQLTFANVPYGTWADLARRHRARTRRPHDVGRHDRQGRHARQCRRRAGTAPGAEMNRDRCARSFTCCPRSSYSL